jgi:hypothetical protein
MLLIGSAVGALLLNKATARLVVILLMLMPMDGLFTQALNLLGFLEKL